MGTFAVLITRQSSSDRIVSHRYRFSSPYSSGVRDARHTRGRANDTPRLGAFGAAAHQKPARRGRSTNVFVARFLDSRVGGHCVFFSDDAPPRLA